MPANLAYILEPPCTRPGSYSAFNGVQRIRWKFSKIIFFPDFVFFPFPLSLFIFSVICVCALAVLTLVSYKALFKHETQNWQSNRVCLVVPPTSAFLFVIQVILLLRFCRCCCYCCTFSPTHSRFNFVMICMWYIWHRCSFYRPISVPCPSVWSNKWLHIILFVPLGTRAKFLIQWWGVIVPFIRFISRFRSSQLFAALMHICDLWFGNHSHWLWIVIPNCQKSSSSCLLAQSIPFDFVW